MIHRPTSCGQTILDRFLVDGLPSGSSTDISEFLSLINANGIHIARQVDYNPAFGGRGARGAMFATTDDGVDLGSSS